MTGLQIYDLVNMTVNIKADSPIGVHVQGEISKAHQGSSSTFSHILTLDETCQVAQELLDGVQGFFELPNESIYFQAFVSDTYTSECFLAQFFFPSPDSMASSRLRLKYPQALAYGRELLEKAVTVARLGS